MLVTGASARAGRLVRAAAVGLVGGGRVTHLLEPATDTCPVDGPWLWGEASDADVRDFTREVDGTLESIVVAAWPVSEDSAETALERVGPDPSCQSDGVTATSVSIGSVGASDARSFEVRERGASGDPVPWKVRGYTWADGHLVTVWSERAGAQPSLDEVRELILEQIDALGPPRTGPSR